MASRAVGGAPLRASVVKRVHVVRALLAETLAELSTDKVMEVLPLELRQAVATDAYMVDCYADRLAILSQCRNEGERKDYVFSLAMMSPKVPEMTDGSDMKRRVARRLLVARTGHMVSAGYRKCEFEKGFDLAHAFSAEPAPWTPFAPEIDVRVLCRSGEGFLKSIAEVFDPMTGTTAQHVTVQFEHGEQTFKGGAGKGKGGARLSRPPLTMRSDTARATTASTSGTSPALTSSAAPSFGWRVFPLSRVAANGRSTSARGAATRLHSRPSSTPRQVARPSGGAP